MPTKFKRSIKSAKRYFISFFFNKRKETRLLSRRRRKRKIGKERGRKKERKEAGSKIKGREIKEKEIFKREKKGKKFK